MPGPTPNPSKIQRSNFDAWTTLPAEGRTTPAPPLRETYDQRLIDLWDHWWATPMAAIWGDFDAPTLEGLLVLYEVVWSGEYTAAHLAEKRQLEDRFGLSPAARKKLYLRVEGIDTAHADEALDAPAAEAPLPAAGGDTDPRRLRAV